MNGKACILVVDDDPDILTVLKANLELHGFYVKTASTCAEADAIVRESEPNLVVLDRILPDGEGSELCRHWGREQRRMPVIMLTAMDSVSDKVLGLESGADDYVIKPFEPLELMARIKACLRRLQSGTREKINLGDIQIDRKSMTVTKTGQPLELTPKEYQLLCLLIDHEGEVLSRETIRKALWKKDTQIYSWSRVIDVHIQHLRQKIEMDPVNPLMIKTVTGTGYRFEPPSQKI